MNVCRGYQYKGFAFFHGFEIRLQNYREQHYVISHDNGDEQPAKIAGFALLWLGFQAVHGVYCIIAVAKVRFMFSHVYRVLWLVVDLTGRLEARGIKIGVVRCKNNGKFHNQCIALLLRQSWAFGCQDFGHHVIGGPCPFRAVHRI